MFGLIAANFPELIGFACVVALSTFGGYKYGRWMERRSKKKGAGK